MKYIQDFLITERKMLTDDYLKLVLNNSSKLPEIKPAQFVEIKVENSPETFLRRPISIHDVDYDTNSITLLIKIVGKGTYTLSKLKKGDFLNIIYPLGNSFSLPYESAKPVLLLGGGCGIAPLLYTAKYFSDKNIKTYSLLGFKDKESIISKKEFEKYSEVFFTTEDGSYGTYGTVMDHGILNNKDFSSIYACGPNPLLKKVSIFSNEKKLNCEVSLENLMACGFGVCLCCVQKTTSGNKCVCTDGPVFNVKDLVW